MPISLSEFNKVVAGEGYGFVYVMSYPAADAVKIGHSLNPDDRATTIGGTLAPEIPVVEAKFWCTERRERVERTAHENERTSRRNGEWFTLSIEQAMRAIEQAAQQVGVEILLVYDRNELALQAAAKDAEERRLFEIEAEADKQARADELAATLQTKWQVKVRQRQQG